MQTSLSLCLCLHLRVSLSITNGQMHSFSWQMHSFLGRMHSFLGQMCSFLLDGTALTYKLCILLLLDYFHPRNYGFVSCLPFTEHVQTVYP